MLFTSIKKVSDRLIKTLPSRADKSIVNNLSGMAEDNVEQMLNGINSDNEQIGEYHNSAYAAYKHAMNSKPAPFAVDLHLTGSFHRFTYAKRSGDVIQFGSTDNKSESLQGRYGENIFGLTDANRVKNVNQILAETISYLNTELQKI